MPIYAFLLEKQGSLKPFFVELPQYQGNNGDLLIASTAAAGATSIEAKIASATTEFGTEPALGDLFTVTDPDNSNHTKAYIVNRIETYETYRGTQPSLGEIIFRGGNKLKWLFIETSVHRMHQLSRLY